jgi:hypothetical protein
MITTLSKFYYGYEITSDNSVMNFSEGGGELAATISSGSYSFTELAVEIATALNAAGALTYTVTANRSTRTYTIAASGTFSLLAATGSQIANGPWALIGFAADQTGMTTYTGTASGSSYSPQFVLQDYVPSTNWRQAALSTVNKTAAGRVELVKFGDEEFMQCNISWITAISQPSGGPITSNASAVTQVIDFLDFAVTKAPLEFMVDASTPATFEKMILESTSLSKDGVGYKLRELYDRGLPGYYETGVLVFRVVE